MSDQYGYWDWAVNSYCFGGPGDPFIADLVGCRLMSATGRQLAPLEGHEDCHPLLDGSGIAEALGVDV